MKNRIISLLLTAIMIVTLIPGTAFAKTYGGEFEGKTLDPNGNPYMLTWIFDEASETLYIEGTGEMPAEYNATSKPWPWVAHRDKIVNLVIEEGITSISKRGFASHMGLKNISFPSTLTAIGMRGFENCKSLESVTIPGTVKTVAAQAFLSCTALKTAVFEDGVINMNEYMFGGCKALEDVYIYSKNTKISRAHSNYTISGIWFRDCNFDILTAHCYEGTDADKYFSEDIYVITNRTDANGNDTVTSNNPFEPNYMNTNGFVLKVEYITD